MKPLPKATYALIVALVYVFSFPCAAQKEGTFTTVYEEQLPFKVKPVAFQEWYAGIKVGGTGINIFITITDLDDNVKIDRVYFRNLTEELIEKGGKYYATLINNTKRYTFKKSEAPADYPFKLKDDECVISYIIDGTTKYLKIASVNEFAGVYYENGPPINLENKPLTASIATEDNEE